jgi:hypothetical protein
MKAKLFSILLLICVSHFTSRSAIAAPYATVGAGGAFTGAGFSPEFTARIGGNTVNVSYGFLINSLKTEAGSTLLGAGELTFGVASMYFGAQAGIIAFPGNGSSLTYAPTIGYWLVDGIAVKLGLEGNYHIIANGNISSFADALLVLRFGF